MDLGFGSWLLAGGGATLSEGLGVAADAGIYAVTGSTASLEFGREVVAGGGSYVVTGTTAGLIYSGRFLVAGGGTYAITGTDATLTHASSYTPVWKDNTGTGYLTYDGAAFGTDSQYCDMVFLLRSLNTNPAATVRIINTFNSQVDVRFGPTGLLSVVLRGGGELVNWTSDAAQDGAGEWLFHITADLGGAPAFAVSKCELTAGVPGAWSSVAGTFATGPTTGTINNQTSGTGNDLAILATVAAANIADCDFAYLWWSHSAPLADSAFADGGVLKNPANVGSPVILITGAALTDDLGSANLTLTSNGTFT